MASLALGENMYLLFVLFIASYMVRKIWIGLSFRSFLNNNPAHKSIYDELLELVNGDYEDICNKYFDCWGHERRAWLSGHGGYSFNIFSHITGIKYPFNSYIITMSNNVEIFSSWDTNNMCNATRITVNIDGQRIAYRGIGILSNIADMFYCSGEAIWLRKLEKLGRSGARLILRGHNNAKKHHKQITKQQTLDKLESKISKKVLPIEHHTNHYEALEI